MTESEDQRLFEGLELEEPSAQVDEAILAFASSSRSTRGTSISPRGDATSPPSSAPAGRKNGATLRDAEKPQNRFTPLVLLAAAVALAPALILLWPQNLGPGEEGSWNVAQAASLEDIEELRSDLDQIKEMAELIPPERRVDQETIEVRIRACLEDLERLELKLRSLTESSLLPETNVLEVNI